MITLMTRCRDSAPLISYLFALMACFVCNAPAFSQTTDLGNAIEGSVDALDVGSEAVATEPDDVAQEEFLTRGQLHEAYAAPHQDNPAPNLLVDRQPPENIEELAPEYQPDGANVQWIPGYWAWDTELDDFIWVSGVWRDVPAERSWEPGYWSSEDDGFRWIAGYWAIEQTEPLNYLPTPPLSVDQGPVIEAPSQDHFYIPGNWEYQQSRYLWRPGYWCPSVENRIWIPARYIWTPSGCVYTPGYWDYVLAQRGTCFAPVYYRSPIYLNRSYRYSPSCRIRTGFGFMVHLFVRQDCGRYFYGDWYGQRHRGVAYRPWHERHSHCRNYDPLLSYYGRSHVRYNGTSCVTWVRNQHQFYVSHATHRPHTRHRVERDARRVALGTDFEQFAKKNHRPHGKSDLQVRSESGAKRIAKKDGKETPAFRKTDNDKAKIAVEDFKRRKRKRVQLETELKGDSIAARNKPGRRIDKTIAEATGISPAVTMSSRPNAKGDGVGPRGLPSRGPKKGSIVNRGRKQLPDALKVPGDSAASTDRKTDVTKSKGVRSRPLDLELKKKRALAEQQRKLERVTTGQSKLERDKRQRQDKIDTARKATAEQTRPTQLGEQKRSALAEQRRRAERATAGQAKLDRQRKLELEQRQRKSLLEQQRQANANKRKNTAEIKQRNQAAERQRQTAAQQKRESQAAQRASQQAAQKAAERSAQQAAKRAKQRAAQRSAEQAAKRAGQQAAERTAQEAAKRAKQQAAQRSAQQAARRASQQAAQKAAERSAQEAAKRAKQQAAQRSARQAAQRASQQAAQRSAQQAAQRASQQAAQKAAQRSAQEAAKRASQQAAQRSAQQAARRASQQAAQKAAQRSAQQAAKRASQQAAQRSAQQAAKRASQQAAQRSAQQAARRASQQAAQKAAQRSAQQAAQRAAQAKRRSPQKKQRTPNKPGK